MDVILRTAFVKPEMLHLSIKYEQLAREHFKDDYLTIFVMDHGYDPKCDEVIDDYPFEKLVIRRPFRHMVCANIMEGLKFAIDEASNFIINMEDDVILHKTYFEFVRKAHNLVNDKGYSVITTWGYSPFGDPSILRQTDYSCGPGTVINKEFFRKYMLQHATPAYYSNWVPTITEVNKLNESNPDAKYSIKKGNALGHLDWDGLMNRLVDYAGFNDGLHGYSSLCFRLLHVGFYGFNRRGRYPSDIRTFDEKVKFLESHIYDPAMLSALDGTYKDYHMFDRGLDSWDGSLKLEVQ